MRSRSWSAAFLAAAVMLLPPLALGAEEQETETQSCSQACYDAEETCYEKCEAADDSAACEQKCQEQADECVEACGDE